MDILLAAVLGLGLGHALDLFFAHFYTDVPLSGAIYRCPECREGFRAVHFAPLLGYALSGGRCPDCFARLPLRALILPLGGAALFAGATLVFDDLASGLLAGFFATVFLTLTLTDIDRRLLPNRIVYPSIILAIAVSWAWPDSSVAEMLAGGLVAVAIAVVLVLLSLPFGPGAFGMGDVKMIVLIGFVVGLPSVLVSIVLGTLIAALFVGMLLITRLRSAGDYIPHGPFLAIGAIIALFWGAEIWDAYRG